MMLDNIRDSDVDVIVVGAGGAGLRAAYEAGKQGCRTLLINKGRVAVSGATAVGLASSAGFAVPDGAGDPEDSPDVHYNDIMTAAQGCADSRLVRILVDEATDACADLDRWGVEFIHDEATGAPLVAQGDFASRPRNRKIYHHGKPVAEALKRECLGVGVTFMEHSMVLSLIEDDKGIAGALVLDREGNLHAIRAKAVVMTTGGAGQLFRYSLMPRDITGDGYALGYRAGADIANMEFMQAGFGTVKPALNILMAWFWAVRPKLLDAAGNNVIDEVLPAGTTRDDAMSAKTTHYPFSASDASMWLEIAAKRATDAGRGTSIGGLYLDLRDIDESRLQHKGYRQLWEISKGWLAKKKMDITKEPLHVGVFGHAINGGIVIDENGQSSVDGLLAAGEAAAGPYGADRLGGNMLLNCQVFGKRAGIRAAELAKSRSNRDAGVQRDRETLSARLGETGRTVLSAHNDIKAIMSETALVVRNEAGMAKGWDVMKALRAEIDAGGFAVKSSKDLWRLYEAENLVDVGLMILGAARLRKETRGSHYRDDAPQIDPNWDKSILIRAKDGMPEYWSGHLSEYSA
ncbi:MAG: FAD-binding protein [Hyphomicrobiales bacterium]